MSAAANGKKKNVSRKMLGWAFVGLLVLGVLGTILAVIKDPTAERKEKRRAEAEQSLEKLQPGTAADAQRQIDDLKKKLVASQAREEKRAAKEQEDQDKKALDAFGGADGGLLPGAPTQQGQGRSQKPATGANQIDPEMLKMLQEASAEANKAPALSETLRAGSGGASPVAALGGKGGGSGIVYDNYGKGGVAGVLGGGKAAGSGGDDDLFGDTSKDGAAASKTGAAAASGIYEATKPMDPPDRLLVSQGTLLPAQLMSAIDTRNAGQVTAIVSRTIYDSFSHSVPLIPQGSKLIGSYNSTVSAGTSRLAMAFTRIILPNGRAINIANANVASQDGTIGIKGKYHSNLLRMVGPAFAVAALGQWVDTVVTKDEAAEAAAEASGNTYYSKGSVIEQTMPTITSAIQQRYSDAKPYMTLKPGQDIRLVLSQDLQFERTDGQESP